MNSKKSDHQNVLPIELAEVVAAAEVVLKKHGALAEVMAATGISIPAGLAAEYELTGKLGAAEIVNEGVDQLRAELEAIRNRRGADARRRQAAGQGLLALEDDLRRVREQVNGAQKTLAAGLLADHSRRWSEACDVMAGLRAEAAALSDILHAPVPMPSPFTAGLSLTTGLPEVRPVASAGPVSPPALPPVLMTSADMLGRLNVAGGLCAGVRQAAELGDRHNASARVRAGGMPEMSSAYRVVRAFECLGAKFEVGALVNRDVLGVGLLYRFWLGKCLLPLGEGTSVVAA